MYKAQDYQIYHLL